jgi:hypothetical protein
MEIKSSQQPKYEYFRVFSHDVGPGTHKFPHHIIQGCGSGFNLVRRSRSGFRIRIRDPGLGAFLTTGSGIWDPGWEKVSIRIRDPG